jgi:N-glycosylase/DNA lyase
MVLNLCKTFGKKMGNVNGIDIYSFPTIENLCSHDIEPQLRQLGFGYRAGYIAKSAKYLNDNPKFLIDLHQSENIKESLMNLSGLKVLISGVGPKVADCIQLMSQGFINQ